MSQSKGNINTIEDNNFEQYIKGVFGDGVSFFLNTDKRVLLLQNVVYQYYKDELSHYEVFYEGDKGDLNTSMAIAKTKEDMEEYKNILSLKGKDYWYSLGILLGYPEIAVDYFTNRNTFGERYSVNYHGLRFICGRKDIEEVSKELKYIYGLPLEEGYRLEEF